MSAPHPIDAELEGTTLIEASAGTGKTYTITTLYLRLLLERGFGVGQILVVTYTRAATAELRERIRKRLSEALDRFERAEDVGDDVLDTLARRFDDPDSRARSIRTLRFAIASFDEAAIFTIHGFCQRVLKEHAFESGSPFDLEFVADSSVLVQEVVDDYWARETDRASEGFVRFLFSQKARPKIFYDFAREVTQNPGARVVPASQATWGMEDDAAWKAAFESARRIWTNARDEVIALLLAAANAKVIAKRTYQPRYFDGSWKRDIQIALESGEPGRTIDSNAFLRFSNEGIAEKTEDGETAPVHEFFDACSELRCCEARMHDAYMTLRASLVPFVREQLRARKEAAGTQSYDDLLHRLAGALEAKTGRALSRRIRRQYPAALIDEFQDTDTLQYGIVRDVWHEPGQQGDDPTSLFLIGDPKQAIYAFRGADVFAYLEAKKDAGDRGLPLDTNWRSDPALIEAVSCIFGGSERPFLIDEIEFEPSRPRPGATGGLAGRAPLEVLYFQSPAAPGKGKKQPGQKGAWLREQLPRSVAFEIAGLLSSDATIDGKAIVPKDVAVLCRTNGHAVAIREALESQGVPAALLGDASVFEAWEALDLERVLRAVALPRDARALRVALATPLFGVPASELDTLEDDEVRWEAWVGSIQRWHDTWYTRGFIQALHQLLREANVRERLLALSDGERRLTNVLHLGELLESASVDLHLGPGLLVHWLSRMRTDKNARSGSMQDEAQLRLERDSAAVTVVTIHKSKGLEYPVVYCPFLWHSPGGRSDGRMKFARYHDDSDNNALTIDFGSDVLAEHERRQRFEALAEDLRLLYVALTRAKHHCAVVWGRPGKASPVGLATLLHDNDDGKQAASDEAMLADLEGLSARSEGKIHVRELATSAAEGQAPRLEPRALSQRPIERRLSARFRHSSFSGLASSDLHATVASVLLAEEAPDHDAVSEPAAIASPEPDDREVRLRAFPAGAAAGTLLHAIFEKMDFAIDPSGAFEKLVEEKLAQHGFEASWKPLVCESLREVAATRWSEAESAPALCAIARTQRIDEMEFLLPVGARVVVEGGAGPHAAIDETTALRPSDLAGTLERHASSDFVRAYAQRLAGLQFLPLVGYLKGFIDLVFEWQGRFHVVDYKSNHLGSNASHYRPSQLLAPMSEHHYVLQYHLYLVALHRYLGSRLAEYDYDHQIGGASYLFVRGMSPENPPECGVFHDRPPRALIEALSRLLDGVDSGGGR